MLRIQLLGSFQTSDDDKPVTRLQSDRLQALLAYLMLQRDQAVARQQLAVAFWPDTTDAQARTNLRTLLARLREALPDADQYLAVDAQSVQWRSDAPGAIDVIEFEQALAANRLAEAIGLYRGDLLPACYDDWITGERRTLFPRRPKSVLRQVVEQRLALMLDFEKINQGLLLIGDWYTAKLYRIIYIVPSLLMLAILMVVVTLLAPVDRMLGQGAAMALEDARPLAKLLRDSGDGYEHVFKQFEADRKPRVEKIVAEGRRSHA